MLDGSKTCLTSRQLDCVWFCFWPHQAPEIQDSGRGSVVMASETGGRENPMVWGPGAPSELACPEAGASL